MKPVPGSCVHHSTPTLFRNLDKPLHNEVAGQQFQMKGFGSYSELNVNHHLGVAQRKTPHWDCKQNYDLQDTERNLSAQHS